MFACKKCGRTYERFDKWCKKCGGKVVKKKNYFYKPKPQGRPFDHWCLPELAEKLDILHSELLEWNQTDPDGLDEAIRKL